MDNSRFMKVYANIPLGIRNEVVVVLDNGTPLSWNAAFVEISSNTELGNQIFDKLVKLELI